MPTCPRNATFPPACVMPCVQLPDALSQSVQPTPVEVWSGFMAKEFVPLYCVENSVLPVPLMARPPAMWTPGPGACVPIPTLPVGPTISLGARAVLSHTAKLPAPTPALPPPESIQYSCPPLAVFIREIAASVPPLTIAISATDALASTSSRWLGLFVLTPMAPKALVPVKSLFEVSSGTWLVFKFRVTLPLVPPPVRLAPAVTPVIVPVPALLHFHSLPLHCRT